MTQPASLTRFIRPLARAGLAAACIYMVSGATGCAGLAYRPSPDEVEHLSEPDAPQWNLSDAFGRPVTLTTSKPARPIVLVFNDADCRQCRQEAHSVAAFALQYRGRIDVYSVQLDAAAADARRFARRLPGVKSIWDPSRQLAIAMNVRRPPQVLFIATDGTTLLRTHWMSLKLRERAEALFKEPNRDLNPALRGPRIEGDGCSGESAGCWREAVSSAAG